MGYNPADVKRFAETYGVDPMKAGQAFGVEMPPPEPPPLPPLPPPPPPVLLAGNEKKPTGGVLDATGQPVAPSFIGPPAPTEEELAVAEAKTMNGGQVLPPWEMNRAATVEKGVASGDLNPNAPAISGKPETPGPAAANAPPEVKGAQDMWAGLQNAGGMRGVAAPKMSDATSVGLAKKALGFDEQRHADTLKAQDVAQAAGRSVKEADSYGLQVLAGVRNDLYRADQLQYEEQKRERAEEKARQDQAAKMIAAKEAEKEPDMSTGAKIGTAISYALAIIGQGLMGSTGKQVDYVGAILRNEDAANERRYQKKLAVINSMKADEQRKHEMMRQAQADHTADYMRLRAAAGDKIQGIMDQNASNRTDKEIAYLKEQHDAMKAEREEALRGGIDKLAFSLKNQQAPKVKVDSDELVQGGTSPNGIPIYYRARGGSAKAGELREQIESTRAAIGNLAEIESFLSSGDATSWNKFGGAPEKWRQLTGSAVLNAKGGGKVSGMNSDKDMEVLSEAIGAGDRPLTGMGASQALERIRAKRAELERRVEQAPKIYGDEGFAQVPDPVTGRPKYVPLGAVKNTAQVAPTPVNAPKSGR